MSSSTGFSIAILATLLFVSSTMGHSQMRCAKYNTQTGACYAPIRNAGESFMEEAYDLTSGSKGLCQSAWTNPITNAYGGNCNGYAPCPLPMGTYYPGETFNVQWVARNHAVQDQTPGEVALYLSTVESVNQGGDVAQDVFKTNKFCTAPYMSCNGKNGDLVNCSAPCTMPSNTQPGLYTLWWKWAWPGHTSVYSTCADIWVVAGGSNTPSTPSTPSNPQQSTTGSKSPSTPSTTGKAIIVPSTTGSKGPSTPSTTGSKSPSSPVTTGRAQPSTTGTVKTQTSTTGSAPAPGKCNKGNMKCLTSETYSTCNAGSWGQSQSCSVGTTCSPSGEVIYCVKTPSTPTPVPNVPASTSTSATSSSSDSCPTMGYQKCTGTNSYSTCGNGISGPTWSQNQSCQEGLKCKQSGNFVYCQ